MSTATHTAPTGANLIATRTSRRWGGFGNLLRKELGQWWTTKLWWIQTLIWVALIAGISTIASLDSAGMTPAEHFVEATRSPFLIGALVIGIGVVVTVQGAVIGEKDQGTAAWIMSKPVSRASFVMSKIVAHSFGFIVTAVVVPAVVYAFVSSMLFPGMLDLGGYAIATSVVALSTVFYVALTVCLGTVFDGRGPVAGLGIAVLLTGQFLNGMLPPALVMRTPWPLGEVAASFAVGVTPEWNRMTPIVATAIGAVVLSVLAVWRFGRDEF